MNKETYIIMEDDRVPYTLSKDVKVGDVIVYGDMIAIAGTSGVKGDTISVYLSNKIVEAPAKSDDDIKVGDKLYWDDKKRYLTLDDNLNTNNFAGHAVTENNGGIVRIILNR